MPSHAARGGLPSGSPKGQSLRTNTKAAGGKPKITQKATVRSRIAGSKSAHVARGAIKGGVQGHQAAKANHMASFTTTLFGGNNAESLRLAHAATEGAISGGQKAASSYGKKIAQGSGSAKSGMRATGRGGGGGGGGGRTYHRDSRGRFSS